MHDQMTIGMFQCSVSMRVSFVLRSAEETLEMIMHLVWFRHRNGLVTTATNANLLHVFAVLPQTP